MSIFFISFRIHEDDSYAERYESTVEAIKNCCHGPEYWDETTSFVLFENPTSSAKIADYIESASDFSSSKDLLLVVNLAQKGYAAKGRMAEADILKRLMQKR